jgi:hypothetical protein
VTFYYNAVRPCGWLALLYLHEIGLDGAIEAIKDSTHIPLHTAYGKITFEYFFFCLMTKKTENTSQKLMRSEL